MESIEAKATAIFIKSKIDQELVHKLIVRTLQIIPCPNETKEFMQENKRLPSLQKFLNRLIDALNLNNGILMFTMIYLNRLKLKLPNNCKGLPSTRHRILLSCLILSIKFNNDFSLKNHDWLKLTNKLFNLKDINLMERQLLYLLNWNLFINESELFVHFNKFLAPIKEKLLNNQRMKQYLLQQQKAAANNAKPASPKSPHGVNVTGDSLSPPTTPTSFTSNVRSRSQSPHNSPASSTTTNSPNDYSPRTPTKVQYQPHYPTSYPTQINTNVNSLNPNVLQMTRRKSSSASTVSSSHSFEYSPYRNDSSSSDNSMLSLNGTINPIIELTALNEQYELNKLLDKFKTTTI